MVAHERPLSEVSRPQQRYKEEVRPLSSTYLSLKSTIVDEHAFNAAHTQTWRSHDRSQTSLASQTTHLQINAELITQRMKYVKCVLGVLFTI